MLFRSPPHLITEGSAIFTLLRNFGSSLFISLCVLVLLRSTSVNYARMTEFVSPFNKAMVFPELPSQWALDTATGLQRVSDEIARQAAMIGYINAFYMMAFAALVAVPLSCMMRPGNRG